MGLCRAPSHGSPLFLEGVWDRAVPSTGCLSAVRWKLRRKKLPYEHPAGLICLNVQDIKQRFESMSGQHIPGRRVAFLRNGMEYRFLYFSVYKEHRTRSKLEHN